MKISERLQLHKLGYTKEEINAMIAEEAAASAETVEGVPVEAEAPAAVPDNKAADILTALNNLTAAIHAKNINTAEQPNTPEKTAEQELLSVLEKL